MTTTTEYGKQNIFAKETPPRLMNENEEDFFMEQAERTNGQLSHAWFRRCSWSIHNYWTNHSRYFLTLYK